MKHIAAYALLILSGNSAPSAADVEKVITDAGTESDKAKIEILVAALAGKKFNELVDTGLRTLGSICF